MPPSVPGAPPSHGAPNPFAVILAPNSAQQPPNSALTCTVGRPSGGDGRAEKVLAVGRPSALTCANSRPVWILLTGGVGSACADGGLVPHQSGTDLFARLACLHRTGRRRRWTRPNASSLFLSNHPA